MRRLLGFQLPGQVLNKLYVAPGDHDLLSAVASLAGFPVDWARGDRQGSPPPTPVPGSGGANGESGEGAQSAVGGDSYLPVPAHLRQAPPPPPPPAAGSVAELVRRRPPTPHAISQRLLARTISK